MPTPSSATLKTTTRRKKKTARRTARTSNAQPRSAKQRTPKQSYISHLVALTEHNEQMLVTLTHGIDMMRKEMHLFSMRDKLQEVLKARASYSDILVNYYNWNQSNKRARSLLIRKNYEDAPHEQRSRFLTTLYNLYWKDFEPPMPIKGTFLIQEPDESMPIGHFLFTETQRSGRAYRIFKPSHSSVLLSNRFLNGMYDYERGRWWEKSADKKWNRRVMENKFESHIHVLLPGAKDPFSVYFFYSFKCFIQDKISYYTLVKMERYSNISLAHSKAAVERYGHLSETIASNSHFREDCAIEGNCNRTLWETQNQVHGWHNLSTVLMYNTNMRTGDEAFIPYTPTMQKRLYTSFGILPKQPRDVSERGAI